MITGSSLARDIEVERFKRFGIDQAEMRVACSIILDVLLRSDNHEKIAISTLCASLSMYPLADFHADREQFKMVPSP